MNPTIHTTTTKHGRSQLAWSRTRLSGATVGVALAVAAMGTSVAALAAPGSAASRQDATSEFNNVRFRNVMVDGINIFYREAGDPAKPTILLLHGFPSSSNMFRNLLPLLSARFHLIAPDYPGFGFSDAPNVDQFEPTFANLTKVMMGFVQTMKVGKVSIYMQDFGGPVGMRIAAAHPDWVSGLIIQNANAYEEGIAPEVLKDMKARSMGPLDAQADEALDQMLTLGGTKFQYMTGTRDPANIDPTSYSVDAWVQAMPEQRRIQKALIVDYYDNIRQYAQWHQYLKAEHPKTLIVWGKNDPIFLAAGATAYLADLPQAKIHFFNTGHFALEEDAVAIAKQILRFKTK